METREVTWKRLGILPLYYIWHPRLKYEPWELNLGWGRALRFFGTDGRVAAMAPYWSLRLSPRQLTLWRDYAFVAWWFPGKERNTYWGRAGFSLAALLGRHRSADSRPD